MKKVQEYHGMYTIMYKQYQVRMTPIKTISMLAKKAVAANDGKAPTDLLVGTSVVDAHGALARAQRKVVPRFGPAHEGHVLASTKNKAKPNQTKP